MCFPTGNNGTLVGRGPQAWKTHPRLWVSDKSLRSQMGGLPGHLHFFKIVVTRNTGLEIGAHWSGLPQHASLCNEQLLSAGGTSPTYSS